MKTHEMFGEIQELLTHGLATMDDSGRKNSEGNSYMLWESYWGELRRDILRVKKLIGQLECRSEANASAGRPVLPGKVCSDNR